MAVLLFVAVWACDEWDDHNKPSEAALNENLLQSITKSAELSKFLEYLTATGYDKVIASSKSFTVWAPSNNALASLPAEIVNDPDRLSQFVANHISYQEYFTSTPKPSVRVRMLSGKYLTWYTDNLEGVGLVAANRYVRNGVLHVIDQAIVPKQNNWELLTASSAGPKQTAYLQSLTYEQFVESLATQIGVDPLTGKPVYEPGTGIVTRNRFQDEVGDIDNEDSLYTFIILTDDAFTAELDKLKPYFSTVTMNDDSITAFASWYLTRDLVFSGVIGPDELPEFLVSQFDAVVPINKSAIVETHFTSNGVVYVMNEIDFNLATKLPTFKIEGEKPTAFSRSDKNVNIHYRYRSWASDEFDLRVRGHGVALFNVRYRVENLPAVTYKVYWKAVNDFAAVTHQQRLLVGSLAATSFPYVTVAVNNFDEIYLGEFTTNTFGYIDLYLVSANSTNIDVNPLVLDYIKLVPQP